jgi:hypothetical protein
MVAIKRIIQLLGIDHYHGTPIPIKYYSIGVEEVFDGKVNLFVTNEANDPFQLHIKDIVRTITLWEFQYIAPTKSL